MSHRIARLSRRRTLAGVAWVALMAATAHAGETDQHYSWLRPVRDSTVSFNERVNAHFDSELRGINRNPFRRGGECRDIAHDMADGLFWTEYRFFIKASPGSGLSYAPRSSTEWLDEYGRKGLYRFAPPWSLAFKVIPLDTTVRLGDVYLGTDKIAHFFPNGWRYYVELHKALDAGQSEAEAFETVLNFGVEQELGWFGMDYGTFSYADLESNWAGLKWFRALCDDDDPLLVATDDGWRLRERFDIAEWVNPCWDESFYGNAYTDDVWPFVKRGVQSFCRARDYPEVQMRQERYRARGCMSRTVDRLRELVEEGVLPDPAPYSVDEVCEETRAPPVGSP